MPVGFGLSSSIDNEFVQRTEPSVTPTPPPDGDGGVWYEVSEPVTGYKSELFADSSFSGSVEPVAFDPTTVYFGVDGDSVRAVDIESGNRKWSYAVTYTPIDTMSVDDNYVAFVVDKTSSSELVVLNKNDGSEHFTKQYSNRPPIMEQDSDKYYVSVLGDQTYAYLKSDGTLDWNTGRNAFEEMVVADEYVFIPANGLTRINKNNGNTISTGLLDRSQSGLAVDGEFLYSGTGNVNGGEIRKHDYDLNQQVTNGNINDAVQRRAGTVGETYYAYGESNGDITFLDKSDFTVTERVTIGSVPRNFSDLVNGVFAASRNDGTCSLVDIENRIKLFTFDVNTGATDSVRGRSRLGSNGFACCGASDGSIKLVQCETQPTVKNEYVSTGDSWIEVK